MSGVRKRWALTCAVAGAVAVSALSVAISSAGVGGGIPPRIGDVTYYEDLEDGQRHNIVADVKRDATVFARIGKIESDGRKSQHVGPAGERGYYSYFFREKKFVKKVLAEFADDGVAKIKVFAGNDGGLVRKNCELELESHPQGDTSNSNCTVY